MADRTTPMKLKRKASASSNGKRLRTSFDWNRWATEVSSEIWPARARDLFGIFVLNVDIESGEVKKWHRQKGELPWFTQDELGAMLRIQRRQIRNLTLALVKCRVLEVDESQRPDGLLGVNRYWLTPNANRHEDVQSVAHRAENELEDVQSVAHRTCNQLPVESNRGPFKRDSKRNPKEKVANDLVDDASGTRVGTNNTSARSIPKGRARAHARNPEASIPLVTFARLASQKRKPALALIHATKVALEAASAPSSRAPKAPNPQKPPSLNNQIESNGKPSNELDLSHPPYRHDYANEKDWEKARYGWWSNATAKPSSQWQPRHRARTAPTSPQFASETIRRPPEAPSNRER
jgi:hypothetical protein